MISSLPIPCSSGSLHLFRNMHVVGMARDGNGRVDNCWQFIPELNFGGAGRPLKFNFFGGGVAPAILPDILHPFNLNIPNLSGARDPSHYQKHPPYPHSSRPVVYLLYLQIRAIVYNTSSPTILSRHYSPTLRVIIT